MTQRPTTLGLFVRHCPKALDHYEEGRPYDRGIFAVGTAAHDYLCEIGRHGPKAVESVTRSLLTTGRVGVDSEPPLPPQAVYDGRDLAQRWAAVRGIQTPAQYEIGLAFDRDWNQVDYIDERAMFRTRLDVLAEVEVGDEEIVADALLVEDYKSSWAADGSLLGLDAYGEPNGSPVALQQRAQAVAVRAAYRDHLPTVIRLRISNLRTLRSHDLDLWLDDPSTVEMLDRWQQDINELCEAAEQRPRLPSPGHRCLGCPYLSSCEAAQEWWTSRGLHLTDPEDIAEAWAFSKAASSDLEKLVKELTQDGPINLTDGAQVGRFARTSRVLRSDAVEQLWTAWSEGHDLDPMADSLVRGVLTAGRLGVRQAEAIAKALYPDRSQARDRREFIAGLVEERITNRLEVRRG